MSRSRRVLGAAAACMGLVLLAGCAEQPAGAAAVVGSTEISMTEVTAQVQAILTTLEEPVDTANGRLTNAVVRNNVVYELVVQAAADAGVTVSQSDVDQRLAAQLEFAGSQALLDQQAAQSGVAPDMIETDIRVSLLASGLAELLAAGQDLADQAKEGLLVNEIQQFSDQVGTTVNPRFGVWDVQTLAVIPDAAAPSQPEPAPSAQLGAP